MDDVITYTNGTVEVEVDDRSPDLHRRLLREGWVTVEKAAVKPARRKKAVDDVSDEDTEAAA